MLSKKQTYEAYNNKDYDLIIIENIPLVHHIINKRYYHNDDYIDLGMIGLIKGVRSFNQCKGFSLSTYLTACIDNEIRNCYKKNKNYQYCELTDVEDKKDDPCDVLIKKQLHESIKKLSTEQQFIINSIYGFDCIKLSQNEIADKLNISQTQISRRYNKILKILKEEFK